MFISYAYITDCTQNEAFFPFIYTHITQLHSYIGDTATYIVMEPKENHTKEKMKKKNFIRE